jgi:hypothetical protein
MNQSVIICSNCRTPNPARNLYCQSCGRPLIPAAVPSAPNDVTQPSAAQSSDQGPTIATTPGQPYAAPHGEQYSPDPAAGMPPETENEYPPQPQQQTYPEQGTPSTYGAPASPQPGSQPNSSVPPFPAGEAPQSYAGTRPQTDFIEKVSSFFSKYGQQTFPVKAGSWSALVNGAGDRADEIEKNFVEDFEKRDLAYVDLARVEVTSGLIQRAYQVARHRAGSVTAYVNPIGKDLMLGWELNGQQKPYWKMILLLGAVTLLVPLFISLAFRLNFWTFLLLWIIGIGFFLLSVFVAAAITGKILKGDIWALFIEQPDPAARQELFYLANAVQQSLQAAVRNAGLIDKPLT